MSDTVFVARVGDEHHVEELSFGDSQPTAAQILEKCQRFPVEDFVLLVQLENGMLEELNLTETVDLGQLGIERFYAFRSDRIHYFLINSRRFPWGGDSIAEETLRQFSGAPADHQVWLERRGGHVDKLIEPGTRVDLSGGGIERFYTSAAVPDDEQTVKLVFATTAGDFESRFSVTRHLQDVKRFVMEQLGLDVSQAAEFIVTSQGNALDECQTLGSLGLADCVVLTIERREVVKI